MRVAHRTAEGLRGVQGLHLHRRPVISARLLDVQPEVGLRFVAADVQAGRRCTAHVVRQPIHLPVGVVLTRLMAPFVPERLNELAAPPLHGVNEVLRVMRKHLGVVLAVHHRQRQRHQVARHVQAGAALILEGHLVGRAAALFIYLLLSVRILLVVPGGQVGDAGDIHDGGKMIRVLGSGGGGDHAAHGFPLQVDPVSFHAVVGVNVVQRIHDVVLGCAGGQRAAAWRGIRHFAVHLGGREQPALFRCRRTPVAEGIPTGAAPAVQSDDQRQGAAVVARRQLQHGPLGAVVVAAGEL